MWLSSIYVSPKSFIPSVISLAASSARSSIGMYWVLVFWASLAPCFYRYFASRSAFESGTLKRRSLHSSLLHWQLTRSWPASLHFLAVKLSPRRWSWLGLSWSLHVLHVRCLLGIGWVVLSYENWDNFEFLDLWIIYPLYFNWIENIYNDQKVPVYYP